MSNPRAKAHRLVFPEGKSQGAGVGAHAICDCALVVRGLAPILKAMLTPDTLRRMPFDLGETGYLLIGLAGGCVALDRFFGYWSGWIRYITTALALEKSLDEFRLEWARNPAKLRGQPLQRKRARSVEFSARRPNTRSSRVRLSVWRSVVRWSRYQGVGPGVSESACPTGAGPPGEGRRSESEARARDVNPS
jgi:SMODS and SLOG-associating 2TM effector domain 2